MRPSLLEVNEMYWKKTGASHEMAEGKRITGGRNTGGKNTGGGNTVDDALHSTCDCVLLNNVDSRFALLLF